MGFLVAIRRAVVAAVLALPASAAPQPRPVAPRLRTVAPPLTPEGLPRCDKPLVPATDLPRLAGETVRYLVDVDGLSVGTIDFKVERRGALSGQAVTEYRSLFKLDSLVATVIPIEGRAASIVPDATFAPILAMSRYKLDKIDVSEDQTFTDGGKSVSSKRTRDGKLVAEKRLFPGAAADFVSGFYVLRSLPKDAQGCAIIYGSQRAYTVWIKPDGQEKVKTPVGMRNADRYVIDYASDKSKKPFAARVWLGDGPDRLPYRAEIDGQNRLEVRIHLYEKPAG